MARLWANGWETQKIGSNQAAEDPEGQAFVVVGSPTINTANARGTGSRACLNCASGTSKYLENSVAVTLGRAYYWGFALQWNGTPTQQGKVASLVGLGGESWSLRLETSNTLRLYNAAGTAVGVATGTLSTSTWYWIEVGFTVPSSGNGSVELRVNGASITAPTANLGNDTTLTAWWRGGIVHAGVTIRVDDEVCNDDQGAAPFNTWPGDTHISLLKPISDEGSGSGTGWVAGAGGTTNLYQALDNLPPVGVVLASATNTSQIKNANNNATDTYPANLAKMTDSLASGGAGMASSDLTVRSRGIARGGSSVGTSRNLVVDIPFVTSEGTLGCGTTIAATDPTGWSTVLSAVSTAALDPTATYSARVRNVSGASKSMMYDLLGLMVEWVRNPTIVAPPASATASVRLTTLAPQVIATAPPLATSAAALVPLPLLQVEPLGAGAFPGVPEPLPLIAVDLAVGSATASAPAPTLDITTPDATVVSPPATASASAPSPITGQAVTVVAPVASAFSPGNKALNGGFEDAYPVWTPVTPAESSFVDFDPESTGWSSEGARSLHMEGTFAVGPAGALTGQIAWGDPVVPVSPGWHYLAVTLNIIDPLPAGHDQGIWADFYDDDENWLGGFYDVVDRNGTAGVVTVEGWTDVPLGATQMTIVLVAAAYPGTFASTQTFEGYFDEIVVAAVPAAGIYPTPSPVPYPSVVVDLPVINAVAGSVAPTLHISTFLTFPPASASAEIPVVVVLVALVLEPSAASATASGLAPARTGLPYRANLPTRLALAPNTTALVFHEGTTLELDPGETTLVPDDRELELVLDG